MIEFACQHCGNVMKAHDHDSGRSACCPACRRFIILPQVDGGGGDVFLLPAEERCTLIEKVLRFMAESAQRTEALLTPYRDAQGTLLTDSTAPPQVENLSQTEEHRSDVRDLKNRLERALTECGERRLASEAAEAQLEERTADTEAERSRREAAQEALETAEASLARSGADLEAERVRREAIEETLETAEAGLAQHGVDLEAERIRREAVEEALQTAETGFAQHGDDLEAERIRSEAVEEALETAEAGRAQHVEAERVRREAAEEALETAEAGLARQATDMEAERARREEAEETLETAVVKSIRGNSEVKEELEALEDRVATAQAQRNEALGELKEERTQRERQRVASDEVTAALQRADQQLVAKNARLTELEILLEAAAGEAGTGSGNTPADDEGQEIPALLPELMDAEDERDGDVLTQAYLRFLNPS